MEFNQIETRIEGINIDEVRCCENDLDLMSISLEAEVPEALYVGMKDFICLLYTSDAADEGLGVDLGGRRIIK